ncbi:MAG: amino acid permease, partial [Rickettsiales bacterium]|nr:amino acid permease [Rickettsiales bacterium]
LVSAELSAKFKCSGGIYTWVKKAYGDKLGLLAIWLQWAENVIWYPTLLSFVAGALGYAINPALIHSKVYLSSSIIIIFWALTYINLKGIEISAWFSNFCTVAGLIAPMLFIIALGVSWLSNGNPTAINISLDTMIPKFNEPDMWVSLTAVTLSFSGIEIASVHASNVENAQSKLPKALAWSSIIILTTLVLGSLAIAIVVPGKDINLVTGIIQAFKIFFEAHNILWVLPIIAVTLAIGGAGSVSNWLIAPTKGLLFAAEDNNLPKIFKTTNAAGSPSVLLYSQAIIVTIISLIFMIAPGINESYWILTVTATQLYMIMYILMFMAFIKLRKYDKENSQHYFEVPGGMIAKWIVAILGIIGCFATFLISFYPPNDMQLGSKTSYALYLIITVAILSAIPYLLRKFAQK